MAFDPVTAVADVVGKIIDRVIPDPAQAAQAKLQLLQLQQSGDLAQLAVDQAEAASSDPLQHWRGGGGWVCVLALGFQFILAPLATWACSLAGHPTPMPTLDTGPLMTLMGGMLGLGGWHAWEQTKK